jgi:ubiquinone/menaquinone biosynthesis C-methylase UbiE
MRFAILGATMGIYRNHIFAPLMDWVMSGETFQQLRVELLSHARGEVLEIGFGTGLNLPHYPTNISRLSIVDPIRLLTRRVRERAAQVPFPVQTEYVTAETLPYPDRQFDSVVSTWTLCTIPDPLRALRETRRVLKPNGIFLFLEHGRSGNPRVAAWQDRLNPLQNIIGCGCNLNRQIDRLVMDSGLHILHLDRFQMDHVPRIVGEMYQGHATPLESATLSGS